MTKEREPSQLPKFKDEQALATFWDTHSPEDFPEEFEEVQATFSRPLIKRGLTIKLSEDTINQLREIAQEQGIGPTTLARMWILEHLREQRRPTP
ncbi:MAG: BrnA antitoxin family protein [Chloroflexi bacterium]|nr:BrnA antitoxin family protein [Chloroflexota bacterium]